MAVSVSEALAVLHEHTNSARAKAALRTLEGELGETADRFHQQSRFGAKKKAVGKTGGANDSARGKSHSPPPWARGDATARRGSQ